VKLAIAPEDAAVEVDGTSAPVREGSVEIVGTPGSGHRVLLRKGAIEQVFDVFVTEAGAQPPRVTLPEDMPAPPAAMTAPRADAVRASATRPGASAPATLRLMAPPPPPMPAPPQSTPAPIPDKDGLERSAE
jgi:serine/threonine-protein kinase